MTEIVIAANEWWFNTIHHINPTAEERGLFWPFQTVDVPDEIVERWKAFTAEKEFLEKYLDETLAASQTEWREQNPDSAASFDWIQNRPIEKDPAP